jgi:uncharacterized membrane protein YheB (UPF0754 family)
MDEQVPVTDVQATPESSVEVEIQNSETPAVEATEVQAEAAPVVQEKMIPQSQVSKIAAREARQAAEKTRQDMLAEFERQQVAKDVEPAQQQNMGGMPQIAPEQMEQYILQAAHRMSTKMTADKMAADFESKIKTEIEQDPDFGDLYDSLNMAQHPELVIWMNGMDNAGKVVKDLANNPSKFANILMLAKSNMAGLAQSELNKLSESIKVNQAAQAQPKVKEPLDQLSPSSIGTGNGELSVSDFMKMDWLRG